MDCCAFCTASSYKIKPLIESLRSTYKCSLYRDVAHIEASLEDKPCDIFYFPYGATVCWGISKEKAIFFLEIVREFEHQRLEEIETDEFTYSQGEAPKIIDDEITLPNLDVLTKLAVSHAMAQSVKLGSFEVALHNTFNLTKSIPEDLANHGKISLSRSEIRRKMGELFIERSSINLHVDVLDTPEFFWEYPELETFYTLTAKYLDIAKRGEVLNQRLDVVHELFEMLGNELNHQHSSRLEWTIIWLIIIEVTLSLLRDVFRVI